jgi:curved DNA-binding protein
VPVAAGDYYDVLGVSRDASNDEIRRAYRKLAREQHPDVNKEAGAEERFKELSEAYDVLRDADKREQYDRRGRAGPGPAGPRGFQGFEGFDVGNGGGVDLDDLFGSFFGGGGRAGRRGGFARRGGDHEAEIELSLEEAARGGPRKISLGDGREYDVTIPAGVRDGQRIRLAGEGAGGAGGGPPGDLFLRVRVRPHPRFEVRGSDLYTDLPVAPWEAALGAEVDVRTLGGKAKVRVPPGSSSGRKLRLRGEGMPGGDLYARVKIVVPKQLEREERELYERLRDVSDFDPRAGR